MTDNDRLISYTDDKGDVHYCEEGIVAELLDKCVLFCGSTDDEKSVAIYVNTNDVFAWGCATAENIKYSEIVDLYKCYLINPTWGSAIWAAKKRGMGPQWCIMQSMMRDGAWTPEMEALPVRDDEGSISNPVIEKYRYIAQ